MTDFYVAALEAEVLAEFVWANEQRIDEMIDLVNSAARQRMLRVGNIHIELFEYSSPEPKPIDPGYPPSDHGYTHLAFDVDDIDAEFDRMKALGMTFKRRPPIGRHIRAIYGRDPDSNIVELQQVLDPSVPFHFNNLEIRS